MGPPTREILNLCCTRDGSANSPTKRKDKHTESFQEYRRHLNSGPAFSVSRSLPSFPCSSTFIVKENTIRSVQRLSRGNLDTPSSASRWKHPAYHFPPSSIARSLVVIATRDGQWTAYKLDKAAAPSLYYRHLQLGVGLANV